MQLCWQVIFGHSHELRDHPSKSGFYKFCHRTTVNIHEMSWNEEWPSDSVKDPPPIFNLFSTVLFYSKDLFRMQSAIRFQILDKAVCGSFHADQSQYPNGSWT